MPNVTVDDAVAAALASDWQKALKINSLLLKGCPNDPDCLNRLGKACLELGELKKANFYFKKVLKINKYDPIATRNMSRMADGGWKVKKVNARKKGSLPVAEALSFLEIPGQTKLVQLVNIAPTKILNALSFAKPIEIVPKRHTIIISDDRGNYVGALPDDLAHRLLLFLKGGNEYQGLIKSVSKNHVTVLLRETVRAKKFHNTPSFPTTSGSADYLSYVREDLASDEPAPVVVATGDDDDSPGPTGKFADEEPDNPD